MAGRFWRCILGLELALAVASAAWLWRHFSWPLPAAISVALAIVLAVPVAWVLLSFLIAQRAGHGVRGRRRTRYLWRAIFNEIAGFALALIAMSALSRPRRSVPRSAAARSSRPVLLLHGFLCNGRVWGGVQRRLYAAGFGPIEAPDLEPLLADIEAQARHVAPGLLALQRRCNGERVVIVAHSMGGLVARTLLRDLGAGVIRRIVTIACPHHGTDLVRGLTWPNARQMSRDSPWLLSLNAEQEGRFAVPMASIYSMEDNLLVPAGSARLRGAELQELRGIGHLGLLRSRCAFDRLNTALSQESPG